MLPHNRKTCIECGETLRMEMEKDAGLCVCCQYDRWPTAAEIMESRDEYRAFLR